MLTTELYQHYPIPANLVDHMLLVASVGTWLAQQTSGKLSQTEQDLITRSLLLHDLANLTKFDLSRFTHFLKANDHDLTYWQEQQELMFAKYGHQEHQALLMMLKELAVDEQVFTLLDQLSIYRVKEITAGENFPLKICLYADYRVAPHGLVSLEERVSDLVSRYHQREPNLATQDQTIRNLQLLKTIEEQLVTKLQIPLTELPTQQIEPLVEKLKNFSII